VHDRLLARAKLDLLLPSTALLRSEATKFTVLEFIAPVACLVFTLNNAAAFGAYYF
jgi:hypothetical protein